jgi:hypothetical protein
MNDTILNAGLLGLLVAVALGAGASLQPSSRPAAAPAADMPVVLLPAVTVTARRQMPADAVVARAQVVKLPAVEVTGRRVPAMETLTLAHAE